MQSTEHAGRQRPQALAMLASERPRTLGWTQAAGLLFGDWGTSRLYVLGFALLVAGRTSFWLILAMSGLVLSVGWAYSQICRLYPDGGGVYTAARKVSRTLAVVGALLLFADYTVTASLSALDGFNYFGLPRHQPQQVDDHPSNQVDAGSDLRVHAGENEDEKATSLFEWDSPGLWAIVAIVLIGGINLLGPKHSSGFALMAAAGMVVITLLIVIFALPQVHWSQLPHRLGSPFQHPFEMWQGFVGIVLALSGCEAIANLTGLMEKPVRKTAGKAIATVAIEVAVFNLLLAIAMLAIYPLNRSNHTADMLAYLAGHYVGNWGEIPVRVIGGVLLLSAANTAVNGIMSILYVMSRDGELPSVFQQLNRFGAPWVGAIFAAGVPILVLVLVHSLTKLADLYAIGVVGAIVINVGLCAFHPRIRRIYRKGAMLLLATVLALIWITLAFKKHLALEFVGIVLFVGLSARYINKVVQRRKGPKRTLLKMAVLEQLDADTLMRPKVLLGTYGSDALAAPAIEEARKIGGTLVVCFIRVVALNYKWDQHLTIDTDLAALKTFAKFLDLGHAAGVPILPVYDSGQEPAELLAETAAMNACEKVLIGTSRQGHLYTLIKGRFHEQIEALLPPEIPVQVIVPEMATA
jgi:amino acid transporter